MNFARIKSAGVELEGGWNTLPPAGYVGDPSVHVRASHVGEAHVRAYTFAGLAKQVTENYPHATDSSCGMHTHISVHNASDYAAMMEPGFSPFCIEHLTAWATIKGVKNVNFWDRIRGRNTYCGNRYAKPPEKQFFMVGKGDHRYSHWCFCFKNHGTAEFRTLPTFRSAKLAVEALEQVYIAVETWLAMAPEVVEVIATLEVPAPAYFPRKAFACV